MMTSALIDDALRQAVVRRRRVLALRDALFGLSAVMAWVLAAMLLDRWVHLTSAGRWCGAALAAAMIFTAACRVGWLIAPRRFDAMRAARFVERIDPAWGERLSTVVTQAALPTERRASAALNAALAKDAEQEMADRPPRRRVPMTPVRPAAIVLAVVSTAWGVAFLVPTLDALRLADRQLRPWAKLPAVTTTQIELMPHADTLRQGESLTITADITDAAGPVTLWAGPDLKRLKAVDMRRTYVARFSTTLLSLQEDFVYRVAAGDAMTPVRSVRVLRVPGVVGIDLTVTPPAGPSVERPGSDGRLRVAAGTKIEATVRASEPLRAMTFRFAGDVVQGVPTADAIVWRAETVVNAGLDWSIDMISRKGVDGTGPGGMRISVD